MLRPRKRSYLPGRDALNARDTQHAIRLAGCSPTSGRFQEQGDCILSRGTHRYQVSADGDGISSAVNTGHDRRGIHAVPTRGRFHVDIRCVYSQCAGNNRRNADCHRKIAIGNSIACVQLDGLGGVPRWHSSCWSGQSLVPQRRKLKAETDALDQAEGAVKCLIQREDQRFGVRVSQLMLTPPGGLRRLVS
jgi:hypothetical protein